MATWSILRTFGKFYGFYGRLVSFYRFGMLYQEKSGSPDYSMYNKIEFESAPTKQ
jgi:hypothetical protein